MGPCSFAEAGRPVPNTTIQASLTTATNSYAATVRSGVPDRALSQNQFDALTSFVSTFPLWHRSFSATPMLAKIRRHSTSFEVRSTYMITMRTGTGEAPRASALD